MFTKFMFYFSFFIQDELRTAYLAFKSSGIRKVVESHLGKFLPQNKSGGGV
jgi:hypothetical protein